MRSALFNDIMVVLQDAGVYTDMVRAKLIMTLDNYDVSRRCTEVSTHVDEDEIQKYIKLFLVNKRVAGRTERTIQMYNANLNRFFSECQKSPLEVTSDDIKLFLAVKEVRDHASKTYLADLLRPISSFYQWMVREEYVIKNPMNKVDPVKRVKTKKDALTETQIEQLRLEAQGDIRLTCILEMLLSTWCRVTELCQIKLNEISEDYESVLIHGKGEKDRTCYINARAKLYLKQYISCRNDRNEYLFPKANLKVGGAGISAMSAATKNAGVKPRNWWTAPELIGTGHIDKGTVEDRLRKLGKKCGIEKVHPHRFRRTGATFALRRGMPIEQVSKLLGHESIETTQIYLDISERELEQSHKKYV